MESQAIYRYEKYSFRMVTPLLVLIALVFLGNGAYIGAAVIFILGGLMAISYQGVIIDITKQQYLRYDRFLNFKFGRWKPLGVPSYVTVVRINLTSNRIGPSPMVGPEDRKGARAFKVNLVVEGDERYISICRGKLDKMTEEALRLGRFLEVKVLDYTSHNKKWIL
jgi:hypothetical protein